MVGNFARHCRSLRRKSTNCAKLALCAVALLGAGCGARIEGTYTGPDTFLESITLRSGGKVNVQFMGMTKQGTWDIDGRELTIKVDTDTQVLHIDDNGCLVGGGFLGTYCKSGEAAAPEKQADNHLKGAYVAGDASNSIRLEFERDGAVQVSVHENGAPRDSARGSYTVDGNQVTVVMPDSPQLVLVRTGDTLEGTVGYATLRFVKR